MKWIFFDLDDTLWDFKANSLTSLRHIYKEYDVLRMAFPEEKDFIDTYHLHNAELWRQHHHGLISSDFLKKERFRRTLKGRVDVGDDTFTLLDESYLLKLASLPQTVEGAFRILDRLRHRFLIGIISNGFLDTQYRKLRSSGLDRYVQRMIISDEVGIQKPDGRIFEYALAETGADRRDVIMVGDNPEADIEGALNAGWKAIHFTRDNQPTPAGAIRIESLDATENAINKLR